MSHLSNMSDARIQQIAQDRERIRLLANQLAQSRRLNQQLTDQIRLLEERFNQQRLQNQQKTDQIRLLEERLNQLRLQNQQKTDQIRLLEERLNENHLQNQRSVRQIPVLENEILHLTQNNEHLTQQNHQLTLKSHQDQQQLTQLNNQLRIHNETIRQLREEILQKNQLIQNLKIQNNKSGQIAKKQVKTKKDMKNQINSREGRQFFIQLSQFTFYPCLQRIYLYNNQITDAGLKILVENAKKFPNLRVICLQKQLDNRYGLQDTG